MKNYRILVIILLLIGCNKKEKFSKKEMSDSLSIYVKKGDSTISLSKKSFFYKKALSTIDNMYNDSIDRVNLSKIMLEFYKLKDWDNFKISSNLLQQKAREKKDSIQLAFSYRYKGNFFKNTMQNDSAFYFYLKAEKIYKKLNDFSNLGNILNNKSIVQYNAGDYIGADKTLTNAYRVLKNSDEKHKIYESLNMMGIISNETKDYKKATEYYFRALKILKENDINTSLFEEASTLNNLGYNYQISGNYKEAIDIYYKALNEEKLFEQAPDLYSILIDNLAYSKFKINETKELPDLFYKALKIRYDINAPTLIVLSKIHLSEYYFKKNDSITSQKFANEALFLAKKNRIPRDLLASLKQISNVDKKKASLYTNDYFKITDSLQEVERKSQEKFARLQLETDEIRQQRDDFEEKSQINLYYLFGTISFFIILIAIRTQRSKNRVIALKQAQQKANEDIYKLIISQQSKLQEGRELEKARIARELHDGVLGRLFGLRLNLGGLNDSTEDAAIAMRLNYINELKLIEQDIREISHELSREKQVLINNFVSIINNLIDEQSKVQNADIKLKVQNTIDWDKLSNITKINLYRILQESLQNINKHANAKNVKINFHMDRKNNLVLKVVDDGKGFHVDKNKPGIGIKNILDRVNECKGVLDIKSEVDKGTKLIITVPFVNNPQLN